METLVLTLDDRLKLRLDALAARNRKPLPDWATDQLSRLAADADGIPTASYSGEWMSSFGSINDPSFDAPLRPLPVSVAPLDASS